MLTDFKLPDAVKKIIRLLNQHHFEAFLVGGCVRDHLLHKQIHDYDIATSALPSCVMEIFAPVCKIIPTGIRHGTVTLLTDGMEIEVTTYRIEQNYINHRTPSAVSFTDDLIQDLSRRDFTINAMAAHPDLGIIDPFGGQQDIKKGIIRTVGDPAVRMEEDALRLLRAFRFYCSLGFKLDKELRSVIRQKAGLLAFISKERVRSELNRILCSPKKQLLHEMLKLQLLPHIFPQLLPLIHLQQETPWHLYDVFDHTDHALDQALGQPLVQRLALIYHDCGKAFTKTYDQHHTAHFKGHAQQSAQIAETALRALTYDNKTIRHVCAIILLHDERLKPQEAALRRFLLKTDFDYQLAYDVLQVQICDNLAKNTKKTKAEIDGIKRSVQMIEEMEQNSFSLTLKELAVNGNDLKALGLQGKQIRDMLAFLLDHVIEQPKDNEKNILIQLALQRQAKKRII